MKNEDWARILDRVHNRDANMPGDMDSDNKPDTVEIKPIKVRRIQTFQDRASLPFIFKVSGWGHVKGENIYLGRHRARCNYPWLGTLRGDKPCGQKLTIRNLGLYMPVQKKIYCDMCADFAAFSENMENEMVYVIDKKSAEEKIVDIFRQHLEKG